MGPLGLSDTEMHEVMQAAQSVPIHLRHVFLQRAADESPRQGAVRRPRASGAFRIARSLAWDADPAAS
jgi:hypothetical protein